VSTSRVRAAVWAAAAFAAQPSDLRAHAELTRAEPAADTVLSRKPTKVRLRFSEPVEVTADGITVKGPAGERVDGGGARMADDPAVVETTVDANSPGTYVVGWRVMSADGHPIQGSYRFHLGAPGAPGARPVEEVPAVPAGWAAAGRLLHLFSLCVMLGLPAFTLIVLRGPGSSGLRARLWQASRLGFVPFALGALTMLATQSVGLQGNMSASALAPVLATHWGTLWTGRLVAGVLVVAASWLGARAPVAGAWPTVAIGAMLLWLTSANGHAASTAPVWLSMMLDWLHLAATVLWAGGLFAFAFVVLPSLRKAPDAERSAALSGMVPRFSTLALVSVQVLLLTGLFPTWAHLDGPGALASTAYGQSLLVKWAAIVLTMVPAALNLLVLRPRLATAAARADGRPETVRLFIRLVGVETFLVILILGAAGLLTALPPARVPAAADGAATPAAEPLPPVLTLAERAGSTLVTLDLGASDGGSTPVAVTLQDPEGRPVHATQVRLRATPPAGSAEPVSSTRMEAEGDRHAARVLLRPAGLWAIEILFAGPDGREERTAFSVGLPIRGAGELLALADEAMNRLHSVTEEREESSGGPPQRTRSTRIAGEGWPDYRLASQATDVVVVGREMKGDVECLVVGFIDPTTGARHRVWIGTFDHRLHAHTVLAPGRFVSSRFSEFDRAVVKAPSRP
jgi:copper transport protein